MTGRWVKAAAVRAIKTVAQAAAAAIGSAALIEAVDWRVVISASLLAGILSLLTSVAGLPELSNGATTSSWIKAAAVRAVKTIAQVAVATIGSAALIEAVDWRVVMSASLLAGILSLLTSVAGLPEVQKNDN